MSNITNLVALFSLLGISFMAATNAKPLKVYVLCGQSNMEGHARISTFEAMKMDPLTRPILKEMIDGKGNPVVCDQVWISYFTGGGDNMGEGFGKLTARFGSRRNTTASNPNFDLFIAQNGVRNAAFYNLAFVNKCLFHSPKFNL